MTFDECTAMLKEAGDKAYACSVEYWGVHYSNLFSSINKAEKAGTNDDHLFYINDALVDLSLYPSVPNVTLTQEDYEFIRSRLLAVKAAIEIPPFICKPNKNIPRFSE